jgi:ABC-type amino acid transport substrate-binding protein
MFRLVATLLASMFLAASVASAQTPSDSRLNRITTTKSIKLAYRTDATPFSFLSPDKQPIGYTIDLCKLVVLSLEKQVGAQGIKIEWMPITTQTRFDVVSSGQADMECGSSTITLGRMKQVDFSSIIFVGSTGVVVKADAGIKKAGDLDGKKIAVIGGTSNQQALVDVQRLGGLPNATLVPVQDRAEGVAALQGGKADAFASDKVLLAGTQFSDAKSLVLLPEDLSLEPYGIALPRGDWAFRLAVNTGLSEAYRNGSALAVFKKWFAQIGLQPTPAMLAVYQFGALPE